MTPVTNWRRSEWAMDRLAAWVVCSMLLAAPGRAGEAERWVVSLGAVEAEFTPAGLDVLRYRDRHLFGDPRSDPRPVCLMELLKPGWNRLATVAGGTVAARLEEGGGRAVATASGALSELDGGPGRWTWRQDWTLTQAGLLELHYAVRQEAAPATPVWQHRLAFILNQDELFVAPPTADRHPEGKPIPVETRDGTTVSPPFGGEGNLIDRPRVVRLPYVGHTVTLSVGDSASRLELWNAWWTQRAIFHLAPPVAETVELTLRIDLSELPQTAGETLRLAHRAAVVDPWQTAEPPPLPVPQQPWRLGQNAPSIIANDQVRTASPAELERFYAAVAPHFEALELMVGWTDWKYDLGWDKDPAAGAHAQAIAAAVRQSVDIGHKHGIKLAVSFNFGGSGPGSGTQETRRQPQFQGETFDPDTGEFSRSRDAFDWANQAAAAFAGQAWRGAAELIGPFDYLFFNEPHYRLDPWYQVPFYSQAALADFRAFVGDPAARFPAKPYARPSDRTDNQADEAGWARWRDWLLAVYARQIRTLTEAVAAGQASNPAYGGAIYFQNVGWAVPTYGVDLDRIAAIPGIALLVAEYVVKADAESWRRFRYYATRHDKPLASFVNVAYYDSTKPGRVRFEGTTESFAQAVQMGIDEHAAVLSLYPVSVLDPGDPGYHAERTEVWRELTEPYAAPRDAPVIVAFGDSVTLGVHLVPEQSYPAQLQALLRQRTGDERLEVVNAGIGGNTVTAGAARLERDVLRRRPQFVLIGFGLNDSAMTAANQPRTPLDRFEMTLRNVVDQVVAAGARPILATLTPVADECYFDRHPRDWYPDGLKAVLAQYDEVIRKVAAEAAVPLLELGQVVTAAGLRTPETCGVRDGVHLTPDGCAQVAAAYADLLAPLLAQQP